MSGTSKTALFLGDLLDPRQNCSPQSCLEREPEPMDAILICPLTAARWVRSTP